MTAVATTSDAAARERRSPLIVSIRNSGRTRPLATAALRRDEGVWSLEAITGYANARPVEEAVRAAFEVLDRLNERAAAAVAAQAAR